MADFLTAAEAARRLGVKPATLYAGSSKDKDETRRELILI